MLRRILPMLSVIGATVLLAGCSAEGGGRSGFSIGKNLFHKDSNLRIYVDGHEAQQNKLRKGLSGYAPFEIKEEVAGTPTFRYEIIEPKKFGFIKNVSMQVHQKFEADFSDIADYVIHPKDTSDPEKNMKPGVDYDLGALGPDFRILDNRHNKEVDKVEFKPGVEYLLVFTVSADKSESVQVYFKTK